MYKRQFSSLVLNVILNLYLIPRYGSYGAALSSLITQSFSGIGQIVFAVIMFKISVKALSIVKFILGTGLVAVGTLFLKEQELNIRFSVIAILLFLGLLLAVKLKDVFQMAKSFRGNGF